MHTIIRFGVLGVAIATSVVRANAQRGGEPVRDSVSLPAIQDAAERASPRIQAARAMSRAAATRIPSASRLPDPQLQLGWMNYDLATFGRMPATGMTQIQLMQMVPAPGKLRIAGQIEASRAEASATRIADAALEIRANAAVLFYELHKAGGMLSAMRDSRRLLQDIAAIASQMYAVGDGRQADVLRANVEIARMDEEIIRTQSMRTALQSRLNALLTQPIETPIGAPRLPGFPREVAPLDSFVALAERNRPALRAAHQDVTTADGAVRLATKQIWPDLQVGVQFGQQSGPAGTQYAGSLMFGVSLPTYARNRQLQMRAEAGAMREAALADLASMRVETRAVIAEAYADLMRARRLAELYRTAVLPQADATVTSSLAAYRGGSVNLMTLLDAQMVLNRYRQELSTLQSDEGKAWAELEMLTGGGLPK